MAQIRPFAGIRAQDHLAAQIIAPPYDVVDEAEAKAIAGPNPLSFLHITRPDVDMPVGADIHGPEAYAIAKQNLDAFLSQGWLMQDPQPCFYLYRQAWNGRTQIALVAACSVEEYDQGLIKKHELTRPDKEQDRVDHIEATGIQTGMVFLAWRDTQEELRALMAEAGQLPMAWSTTTDDGVEHGLQVISEPGLVGRIQQAFAAVPALYVCDGHHRSAAASRVARQRGNGGESAWFLAGVFPDSQLEIMAYNRMVKDLNGHSSLHLMTAISEHYELRPASRPLPSARGEVTMFLSGQWWSMTPRPGVVPADPVGSLDVSVLQNLVLAPLLGIANPRTDKRIEFVGGIRGWRHLQSAVESGRAAIAFHMYPTGMDQLLAVADAGQLMPPKSTWFEPKLRGGVVAHAI